MSFCTLDNTSDVDRIMLIFVFCSESKHVKYVARVPVIKCSLDLKTQSGHKRIVKSRSQHELNCDHCINAMFGRTNYFPQSMDEVKSEWMTKDTVQRDRWIGEVLLISSYLLHLSSIPSGPSVFWHSWDKSLAEEIKAASVSLLSLVWTREKSTLFTVCVLMECLCLVILCEVYLSFQSFYFNLVLVHSSSVEL